MSNQDYGFYEDSQMKEGMHGNKQGKKGNYKMNRGGNQNMMEDKRNKDDGNMDYNQGHSRNFQGGRKNNGYGNKKMKRKRRDMDYQQQLSNLTHNSSSSSNFNNMEKQNNNNNNKMNNNKNINDNIQKKKDDNLEQNQNQIHQNMYNNNKQYQNFMMNNSNMNQNNSSNITPQRKNQMTTPFGYNNNINLNSPLNSSTTNNSSNMNYSPNFLNSLNFNQSNSNSNQHTPQQQKQKTPQIYMNPNLSYLTGISQILPNQRDSIKSKDIKNQNEESLNANLMNNNGQFLQGDMYMGAMMGNHFLKNNYATLPYGMNNIPIQFYEQQNPQMFHPNNNNLNYSFQLNEEMINNNINKKLKKNNNISLNLNKGQLNYDLTNNLNNSMNLGNMLKNFNYNDTNNKFFQNNNNHNLGTPNNKGSLSMQGMKNTMPNFNLNENLNFPMMPGNSQQLLNNRNTQRGFYNQQNNLFNGNLLNNNISNSGKMMRNEKISNAFKKDPKYGINSSNKKNQKQYSNYNLNNNYNYMTQDLKNNNNFDNRNIYKQPQNAKSKGNIMFDNNLYMKSLEDQGMTKNINNNQNMSNFANNNNEMVKNNNTSLIIKIKLDEDKYESFEINLNEYPFNLQKKLNFNPNLFMLLNKKISDMMEKIKKIFNTPLKQNSTQDLMKINEILFNQKFKGHNNFNANELGKNNNNIMRRKYSFNLGNSFYHKKFINEFLFSPKENKMDKKLNVSH